MHRFGIHKSLRQPGWKDLLKARPWMVFRVAYPALFLASLAVATLYAFG